MPSIHAGYLAAIFEKAGHDVRITKEEFVEGDIALILSSLVDYKHEVEWAQEAKKRYGMRVGFFGAPATHMTELLQDHADFIIKGEPEQAGMRIVENALWFFKPDSMLRPIASVFPFVPIEPWHV